MNEDKTFEYGGCHFIPERKLTDEENDFAAISQKLRIDPELGFCRENYAYPSRHPYSREAFLSSATDQDCDLFRCVENGRLYIPCENDLQEYDEYAQSRSIEKLRELMMPVFDRLMMRRFPSAYAEVPDSLINFVVEDVFNESAWRAEGRFSEDDVIRAIQSEIMICVHQILGKQPTRRYQDIVTQGAVKLDSLDIRLMSPLEVQQDMTIGDRAVLLARIGGGQYSGQYMTGYRYHDNGRFKYTDVIINRDYFEAVIAFTQHIQNQADKTRIEISEPFFDGTHLEPIDRDGCQPLSADDSLVGRVVVIRAEVLRPEYQVSTYQLRLCTGGFGAYPRSRGSACFCKNLINGKEGRFEREDILGTIAPEQLPLWAREKLKEIRQTEKKKENKDKGAR